MINDDIQHLLDGDLGDEQSAELLHLLSVNPEGREAFRQHMSLRGAMERDRSASAIKDSEDERIWAAVVGATGGATVGTVSGGSSGWLGKAAALALTAAASFLLGLATGSIDFSEERRVADRSPLDVANTVAMAEAFDAAGSGMTRNSATADVAANSTIGAASSMPATVNELAVDRAATRNVVAQRSAGNDASMDLAAVTDPVESLNPDSESSMPALNSSSNSDARPVTNFLAASEQREKAGRDLNISSLRQNPVESRTEPQEDPAVRMPSSMEEPELMSNASGLMRNGFEAAYSERFGRIAPAPVGVTSSDPDFSSRAVEISYRALDGRVGVGARAQYGTFSQVRLEESTWYELGTVETIFEPTLQRSDRMTGELFLNYRLPVSSNLAATAELAFGSSNAYTKMGGDLGLILLITDWMGAHAAAGYSNYWYSIHDQRRELMDRFENTGVTDAGISDFYRGSMFEGRYGLFFRF